jgi:hypothetical protein
MGLPEDLQEKPSKLAAEIADYVRETMRKAAADIRAETTPEQLDSRLGTGARAVSMFRPFAWLGWLSEKLPWWLELLLILALIIGVLLGWNSFKQWAAKDVYNGDTTELQKSLATAKAETQAALDAQTAATEAYLAEKAKVEILENRKAEIVHEVQRVIVTVDKANKGYIVAKETPVAAFTMTGDVVKDHRKVIEEVGRRINLAEAVK